MSNELIPDISQESTLSLVDHLVSQSRLRAAKGRRMMNDGCGRTSPESFAYYDPVMCCWRTPQVSLLGVSIPWSGTFPQAGIASNGRLYRRRPLVPYSCDFASYLLPTLTASDAIGGPGSSGREGGKNLRTVIRLLPTLTVSGNYNRHGASENSGDGLMTALGGPLSPEWLEWYMGFPIGWTELGPLATQ